MAPAIGLAAAVALGGWAGPVRPPVAAADGVVFTAAGDIDGCAGAGADTARIVKGTTGPVATIGDNAYPDGSAGDYSKCYDPTWGAFKDRTHPVPGNHDYDASRATPYYQYFGAAAGQPGSGWYSYDVGAWHVVALNSNCTDVNCSKETDWLDGDLTAHPSACLLAYWHHPRFSSGTSGGDADVAAFWKVLYAHGAAVVLNGHDHDYERFAPQDPSGRLDRARGIREFIVGTGGAALGSLAGGAPNSEVRNNRTYGVLELTLRPDGYDWRFLATGGDRFTDSGRDTCRGTAPAPAPAPDAPAPTVEPAAPPAGPDPAPAPASPADDEPPMDGPPAPAPAGGSAPPRSASPPSSSPSSRPAPSSSRPRPTAPGGAAAGSSPGRAGSPPAGDPSDVSDALPVPIGGGPSATTTTGDAAAAPPAEGAPPAGGSPPIGPGAAGPWAEPDDATMPLAIAGLIHGEAPRRRPDRRSAALLAAVLLAADGLAIGAMRARARYRP